jgi:hypothetical protein
MDPYYYFFYSPLIPISHHNTSWYSDILVNLRAKISYIIVSHRYDVGYPDTCHILEGDNVFWVSLLMFVLSESKLKCTIIIRVMSNMYLYCMLWVITYVMDDYLYNCCY